MGSKTIAAVADFFERVSIGESLQGEGLDKLNAEVNSGLREEQCNLEPYGEKGADGGFFESSGGGITVQGVVTRERDVEQEGHGCNSDQGGEAAKGVYGRRWKRRPRGSSSNDGGLRGRLGHGGKRVARQFEEGDANEEFDSFSLKRRGVAMEVDDAARVENDEVAGPTVWALGGQ